MKQITLTCLLLIILALAACGQATLTPTPAVENDNPLARPTPTNFPDSTGDEMPAGYPPPLPTASPFPEGYPAPIIVPTYDPYPAQGETTWVLHPVGIQCEDTANSEYPNEQEAVSALTAAGITVQQITTTELMVCTACDCPTSAHYRAEINTADINKAIALGWTPE